MRTGIGSLVLLVVAGGCAGADLPAGWEDAERIAVTQSECAGNPYERNQEAMQASPHGAGIDLVYQKAHFRCEQTVEAFVRTEGERIDLLFQPVDMEPGTVAACDCLYDLTVSLEADPGAREVTVYRRWDNLNTPNDPVPIGSASVTVP